MPGARFVSSGQYKHHTMEWDSLPTTDLGTSVFKSPPWSFFLLVVTCQLGKKFKSAGCAIRSWEGTSTLGKLWHVCFQLIVNISLNPGYDGLQI